MTRATVKNSKFRKYKMAVAAILKSIKITISRPRFKRFFNEIWPDDTLYVRYMYEQQLSDFVRFWCIFCMVSFTRRMRIAGGRFWCAACNSSGKSTILRSKSLLVDNGHVTTPTDR